MNTGPVALALVLFALPVITDAQQPAPDARAKRAYRAKCAACHGEDGKGQTQQAKDKFGGLSDLTSKEVQKGFDDAKLKDLITKGSTRMKDGKELKMPAAPDIAGDQLDGLVRYVRGLAAGK